MELDDSVAAASDQLARHLSYQPCTYCRSISLKTIKYRSGKMCAPAAAWSESVRALRALPAIFARENNDVRLDKGIHHSAHVWES